MNSSMNQIPRAQASTSLTARGFQKNPEHLVSNQNSDVTPLQSHIGTSTQHSNQLSSLQRPQSFASSIHSSDMAPLQPPGTMLPGTPLSLNGHSIIIEKFLAEGGFAHVYLVNGGSGAKMVLKRISCPDQSSLNELIKEAQIHRKLSGHECIVEFFDFSYSQMMHGGGGFELMILMEYCQGGTLVDYLNSRLENRPQEQEILFIFSQICSAVAHMHSFSPSIVHRDIKIENVLLNNGKFKLCDFGSCTTDSSPANTFLSIQEIRKLEDEISRLTTLQYRAPEMCDLYQKKGLSEKVDIWALGVLLHKLCFYTTPFEESGTMAILNGTFSIPDFPSYSVELKNLINMTLLVDVEKRPDIYQIYQFVCGLIKIPYPLSNKISIPMNFSQLQSRTQLSSLSDGPFKSITKNSSQSDLISMNITPMRRGRPQKGEGGHPGNLSNISSNEINILSSNLQIQTLASSPSGFEFQKQNQPMMQNVALHPQSSANLTNYSSQPSAQSIQFPAKNNHFQQQNPSFGQSYNSFSQSTGNSSQVMNSNMFVSRNDSQTYFSNQNNSQQFSLQPTQGIQQQPFAFRNMNMMPQQDFIASHNLYQYELANTGVPQAQLYSNTTLPPPKPPRQGRSSNSNFPQ